MPRTMIDGGEPVLLEPETRDYVHGIGEPRSAADPFRLAGKGRVLRRPTGGMPTVTLNALFRECMDA